MKALQLVFVIFFLGIQLIQAQDQAEHRAVQFVMDYSTTDEVKLYPNPVADVLEIQSSLKIDLFRLYDKNGKIVLEEVPKNNTLNLSDLKSGFYLYCAYSDGVQIKKGILKKRVIANS